MAVFGQNEFAARFWCATFGVLTVGMAYLMGKHWKGERAGLLSGSILATSLMFFCSTQYLVLDMALTVLDDFRVVLRLANPPGAAAPAGERLYRTPSRWRSPEDSSPKG